MIVTFDNGALLCTSFTGELFVHLKQTIKSSCVTFTLEKWKTIHERLEDFDATSNGEIHFQIDENIWIILCSTTSVFTIIRREHAKGGKCSVKTCSLPTDDFRVLLRSSQTLIGGDSCQRSNPEPPSVYIPPSLKRTTNWTQRPSTPTLPLDDNWLTKFANNSCLPQM
jgi:hypothetical protein